MNSRTRLSRAAQYGFLRLSFWRCCVECGACTPTPHNTRTQVSESPAKSHESAADRPGKRAGARAKTPRMHAVSGCAQAASRRASRQAARNLRPRKPLIDEKAASTGGGRKGRQAERRMGRPSIVDRSRARHLLLPHRHTAPYALRTARTKNTGTHTLSLEQTKIKDEGGSARHAVQF